MLSTSESHAGRFPRPPARVLLASLLLGMAGCGWLYTYEGQMATEQQRMLRFDEENEYLGAPLDFSDMPKPKDPSDKSGKKQLDLPIVFFRPPLGIGSKPEKGTDPGQFLHYVRDGKRPAGKSADRLVYTDIYVWIAPAEQKDFAAAALRDFSAQLQGIDQKRVIEYPLRRVPNPKDPDQVFKPLVYSPAWVNPAAGGLSLYISKEANVAIAFQLDKGRVAPPLTQVKRTTETGSAASVTLTDLSLESLGVENEARVLHRAYDLRRRHR